MELFGSAADFDGAQIFLVTDVENARGWRGTANGKGEDAAGSDWAKAFSAIYGYAPDEESEDEDEDDAAAALRLRGLAVDVLDFGHGGWLQVFGEASRVVLVDGAYDDEQEVRSRVNGKESVPADAGFTKYLESAPAKKAARLHTIDITSGWLLLMSATASFAKLKPKKGVSLTQLDKLDAACLQVDDHLGGHALLLRMPKGRYHLVGESERKGKWGSAERVLVVPTKR